MSAGRVVVAVLAWAVVGLYGLRAVEGGLASLKFERGIFLESIGYYEDAVPRLDAAALGGTRMRARRTAGKALIDRWMHQADNRGASRADAKILDLAAQRYLECRCIAPASKASLEGLANVYDSLERVGRETRSYAGLRPVDDPWLRVGRVGRVAIGMMRGAAEIAPHWFLVHDWLAIRLWSYGLDEPAREAVRQSARALPVYSRHKYRKKEILPDWFAEEFAAASREVLGQVQMFPQIGHLIDLGKLERRIGETDRAIAAFERALERGGDDLQRGEANFNLGVSLIDAGRGAEGAERLELAGRHPRFRAAALRSLATLAANEGRLEQALDHLRSLRWEKPDSLWPSLEFARVAMRLEDWPAVIEALSWAKQTHPDEEQPYELLTEAYLDMGDLSAARATVDELSGLEDAEAGVKRLLRKIAARSRNRSGN